MTDPDNKARPVEKFLGDRPGSVIVRLIFISLIVGAVMAMFELSPQALVEAILRFFRSIWEQGFDAVYKVAGWLIAGALIVVPVWLVARLLKSRNA